MVLELTSPPWRVQAVSRDDLGPGQDLPVQGPYQGAQLTRAPPRQCVNHGFKVAAEVDAVTPALKNAAVRTFEWVRKLSERAVGQGLPVPERFFRGFGPETGPFKPPQVSSARSREAFNGRVPSLLRPAGRKVAPQG